MMKKYLFGVLALGAAFALIPSALKADSFAYRTSDSRVAANFAMDKGPADLATVKDAVGTNTIIGFPGTIAKGNETPFTLGTGTGSLTANGDSGFTFDNPLNQNNSVNGILERGGVLVDLSGNEVNLLFGSFSGSKSASSAKSGHSSPEDKGRPQASNLISRGNGILVAGTATLAATPEPGSLFLLGTGLLCMALVLFRKAAKRSTGS